MLIEKDDKMKDYKIILTDCDGVLLDWEGAFHNWMSEHGYETVAEGMYDIGEQYGLLKVEAKKLIKIFNESAWMGYLKAFRDARSGVAKLYEHGYRFHCITSLSLDQKAHRLRQYNLENVFGKGTFKELVCLDTGADKDEALVKYKDRGLRWSEDKTEKAECGLKYGLKPILIGHNHNEGSVSKDVIRLMDWNAITTHILETDNIKVEQAS
jgi:hypothetical protein